MDDATATRKRLSFVRICIVIQVGFIFPETVIVKVEGREVVIGVECTWRPVSCDKCKRFCHQTNKCGNRVAQARQVQPPRQRRNLVATCPTQVVRTTPISVNRINETTVSGAEQENSTVVANDGNHANDTRHGKEINMGKATVTYAKNGSGEDSTRRFWRRIQQDIPTQFSKGASSSSTRDVDGTHIENVEESHPVTAPECQQVIEYRHAHEEVEGE
ncbi:hypothetical protein IFM89_006482 [Coptis chinensis]|uniref:Uncharacterized protein n=1 Tax=Coptis chinensis TaxID=261450 RepID=A0A835IHX7_9MAGN|nr:hypothetical protein IFM89_006482 [Coptis chinensis]